MRSRLLPEPWTLHLHLQLHLRLRLVPRSSCRRCQRHCDRNRGCVGVQVRQFYTAPTLLRSLLQLGDEWPQKYDRSSLRVLGSVGEPINEHAWHWFHDVSSSRRRAAARGRPGGRGGRGGRGWGGGWGGGEVIGLLGAVRGQARLCRCARSPRALYLYPAVDNKQKPACLPAFLCFLSFLCMFSCLWPLPPPFSPWSSTLV